MSNYKAKPETIELPCQFISQTEDELVFEVLANIDNHIAIVTFCVRPDLVDLAPNLLAVTVPIELAKAKAEGIRIDGELPTTVHFLTYPTTYTYDNGNKETTR